MTREEAVKELKLIAKVTMWNDRREAVEVAIEALQEPKTIIGIEMPYGSDKGIATTLKGKDDKLILEEVKEIITVVRCKDCRYKQYDATHNFCEINYHKCYDDDFCAWGERKGGDDE